MQSQNFNLAAGAIAGIQILGDFFAYESGSSAGSSTLLVKPENGNEIILKPGQQFRVKEKAGRWFIRANDGASVITGSVIIGEGTFADNNGTITGAVSAAISNQPTVNLAMGTEVQEKFVAYTAGYSSSATFVINTPVPIVSPAQNINGVLLEKAYIQNGVWNVALLAKTTAPTNIMDGDLLLLSDRVNDGKSATNNLKLLIPAGKGIYEISDAAPAPMRGYIYRIL